jgi:hypothetical protein
MGSLHTSKAVRGHTGNEFYKYISQASGIKYICYIRGGAIGKKLFIDRTIMLKIIGQ